jgi:hypothetical protein
MVQFKFAERLRHVRGEYASAATLKRRGGMYSASTFDELGLASTEPARAGAKPSAQAPLDSCGDSGTKTQRRALTCYTTAVAPAEAMVSASTALAAAVASSGGRRAVRPRDRRLTRAVEKLGAELERSERNVHELRHKLQSAEGRLQRVAAELKQSRSSEQMAIAMLQEGWS